jgi:pimeloyl-ACP methyl ester carboxylesterase
MRLWFEKRGNGPPLLLIPGFSAGSWMWWRNMEELEKTFTVITFDPRGIGNSFLALESESPLRMEDFVSDVALVLDDAGYDSVNMIGVSFGGMVALTAAMTYPDRINKLILVSTTAGGTRHVRPNQPVMENLKTDGGLDPRESILRFLKPSFSDSVWKESFKLVEEVCDRRLSCRVSERTYSAQLMTALTCDLNEGLSGIRNETLVLTGDSDGVVPMENSTNLVYELPDARLEIINGGSHMFFIEEPETFNSSVSKFIVSQYA